LPRDWRLTLPGWATLRTEGLALFKVGRWLWLAHTAALLAAQLDLLLVNHWRDAAETGTYALALNLAAKADIVNVGLYTVLLPAAAALSGSGAVRQYMRRGLLRSGLIALALLPTGLLIGPFIDIFYGTAYHPAARLYQLLLVVVIFDLFTTPIVLLAYHHQRPQLLAGADLLRVGAMLTVGTILIPVAGPLGGVTGAVIARLAAKVTGVLLVLLRLPRGGKGGGSPGVPGNR
jgi:O-antigen/teichoic acid export membrane protein